MDNIVDTLVKYAFQLFVVLAAIVFLNQLFKINETNVKIVTELTSMKTELTQMKVEITRGLGIEEIRYGGFGVPSEYRGKLVSIDRRLESYEGKLGSIDRRLESIDRTLKFK